MRTSSCILPPLPPGASPLLALRRRPLPAWLQPTSTSMCGDSPATPRTHRRQRRARTAPSPAMAALLLRCPTGDVDADPVAPHQRRRAPHAAHHLLLRSCGDGGLPRFSCSAATSACLSGGGFPAAPSSARRPPLLLCARGPPPLLRAQRGGLLYCSMPARRQGH
jgi:hypothetical protein